jgi:RNA polymerase sigma factor (sigma-70 family)
MSRSPRLLGRKREAETPTERRSLDDALQALATFDERKARVVEMRYFGGLGVEETAEVLEVSPQTVLRDWKLAKVWLLREMKRGEGGQPVPGDKP